MSEFVDTNVFVRLLAGDDPSKTARCLALFRSAERGEIDLETSEVIVAELVYVLGSRRLYNLPRSEVVRLVQPLIEIRGLRIDHKRSVLAALELYGRTGLDFEDCLAIEHSHRIGCHAIVSYDREFDAIAGVARREP